MASITTPQANYIRQLAADLPVDHPLAVQAQQVGQLSKTKASVLISSLKAADPSPATDRQRSLIAELIIRPGVSSEAIGRAQVALPTVTKVQASQLIDLLSAQASRSGRTPDPAPVPGAVTEGLYLVANVVFKVQWNQGRTSLYVKELVPTQLDGKTVMSWEYRGRGPLGRITLEDRLTAERAAELGHQFGICVRCSADLTDERSVVAGYGETCARHEGWPYPTKAEAAEAMAQLSGHRELDLAVA